MRTPIYIGAPLCLRHSRTRSQTIVIASMTDVGQPIGTLFCTSIRPPQSVEYFFNKQLTTNVQ